MKKATLIPLLLFIITISVIIGYKYYTQNLLKNNNKIEKARVYDTGGNAKGSITIYYIFSINNMPYKGTYYTSRISSNDVTKFKGRYIPVLFSINDPNNNVGLLLKKDFEEYNLLYPDSLKWIEDLSF
jgi:hypothetical protein